jgi:hypothetical protein
VVHELQGHAANSHLRQSTVPMGADDDELREASVCHLGKGGHGVDALDDDSIDLDTDAAKRGNPVRHLPFKFAVPTAGIASRHPLSQRLEHERRDYLCSKGGGNHCGPSQGCCAAGGAVHPDHHGLHSLGSGKLRHDGQRPARVVGEVMRDAADVQGGEPARTSAAND